MTDVSLKEHIEAQIRALDRFVASQVEAIKDAVKIALDTLNKRLEGMNEFRDALKDQSAKLATKDDIKAIDDRLKLLELRDARIAGMAAGVALIVSVVVTLAVKLL